MKKLVGDFETTTYKNDCRVWAYALCDVDNFNNKIIGNDLNEFMQFCANKRVNYKIYFHRLEFDGQFIISWLFKNGFRHVTEDADRKDRTFTTTISSKGIYYRIEAIFERKGRSINKVTFENSYNLIPLSVKKISEAFRMPIQKLEIDYEKEREIGHELTEEEKEYISNDVEIVARAIKYFHNNGLDKMTIGSCALEDFKKTIGPNKFKTFFPSWDEYDLQIRQTYKGGYTYLEPEFAEKTLGKGIVLDINSTHPYTMYACELPHGVPVPFKGQYKCDETYPLYVQAIKCQFRLKPNHVPTVQIRFGSEFSASEFLTTSGDTEMSLCMTSVDLELFFEHYDVFNVEYHGGWMFRATTGLFKDYIDKWYKIKVDSKESENWEMYEIAKRMLNALYGKFGTIPNVKNKFPYLGENGVIEFKDGFNQKIDGVYLPVATFITSYSRQRIVKAIQKIKDDYASGKSDIRFVYADTDSLHCLTEDYELPQGLDIDDTEIGKFKIEGVFKRARFLRQKCYIQEVKKPNDDKFKLKVIVSGMPEECQKDVTFKNFKYGSSYTGNLKPVRVPGGVVLEKIDFTLKK